MKRLLLLVSLSLVACDDPLAEAQRIESTRVLGARLAAGGDPTRAWPAPGEAASLEWLVADPRPAPELGWKLAVCIAAPTSRGIPLCEEPAFIETSSAGLDVVPPRIDFETPVSATLGERHQLLAYGAICSDAEPDLRTPLEQSSCEGDLSLVVFPVEVERDAGNSNPSISDEVILLDGVEWAPATNESDTCLPGDADPSLPLLPANGKSHSIHIQLSPDDREADEELWVSQFSTRGRLDRPLSVVPSEASSLSVDTKWEAPPSSSSGHVVRFWFVVRDLRGGVDWTVRTVCAS